MKQSLKKRSTYQEEQALALVMYHLYKFALNTNCVLAFVRNPESNVDSTKADDDASVMDLNMFKELVHQLSSGESPRSVSTSGAESKNVEEVSSELDSPSSISSPSLIRPGSIDSDLVENTMLKNASCDGQWDASKDSLDVALPSPLVTESVPEETQEDSFNGYNDDDWLSKLASSMKTIEVPVGTKDDTKSSKSIKAKDTKKDVAVSSFFENLLKK